MKKVLSFVVISGLAAGLGIVPQAAVAKTHRSRAEQRFSRLDTNHDGKLSLNEFIGKHAWHKKRREKEFKKLDTNNDGFLSLQEYSAAFRRSRKHKK